LDGASAFVWAENGRAVKMRARPDHTCALWRNIACGEIVRFHGASGGWGKITYHGRTGYMMERFLILSTGGAGA